MDYDVGSIEMVQSEMYINQAMSVDSEGRLYGWGHNTGSNPLGHEECREFHKPTPVDKFNEKYKALEVHVGREFAMIPSIIKESGERVIVSLSSRSTPSLYGVERDVYDRDNNNYVWEVPSSKG